MDNAPTSAPDGLLHRGEGGRGEGPRFLGSSDLNYLLTKLHPECEWRDNGKWLAFVLRRFGNQNVTEALRRVDRATPVSAAYFYGIVRNVAEEAGMS